MNSEEYQRAAARTDGDEASYAEAGKRARSQHFTLLRTRLAELSLLDEMKRSVCYGKSVDLDRIHARDKEIMSADFSKLSPRAFHYLLGMMAEIPEIALALVRGDNIEAAGELGDLEWFRARLASHIGASLSDIHAGNIAKLKVRRPEKFSDDDPGSRDLEAERAALEGEAKKLRVCIESPLAGDYIGNIAYAKQCLSHALSLGYAPFASHLLYPQVLDDEDDEQRERGIEAGLAFGDSCDERWFYVDRGWSEGMLRAKERAEKLGQLIRMVIIERVDVEPTVGFHNRPSENKRVAQLARVQQEALELFRRKNADYGGAFEESGLIGVFIRIREKLARLINVSRRGVNLVSDEGLRDTKMDLQILSGIAVMLMDEEADGSNQ